MPSSPSLCVTSSTRARDRLIRLAATHPEWVLGFQDECWWSRLAQPNLHAWTADDPLCLQKLAVCKEDPDPKALACYGLLRGDTGGMLLRFVDGRPVSQVTEDFLAWVCQELAREGKKALLLVWDNASWHISKRRSKIFLRDPLGATATTLPFCLIGTAGRIGKVIHPKASAVLLHAFLVPVGWMPGVQTAGHRLRTWAVLMRLSRPVVGASPLMSHRTKGGNPPMRPLTGFVWGCALALLAAGTAPSQAAWCNAFQVCCNSCDRSVPATSFASPSFASPAGNCCDPCPRQVCTTRMVQRCYYQPVTCYQQKTWTEAVTSYRTSFYCEPVTTFRYSCVFDPCTCSYKQVAVPQTSFQMRSRCCPVTSYLQRTCMVPVTTLKQVFYFEPQTTCCTAPTCPTCPTCPSAPSNGSMPRVDEQREPPGMLPSVDEQREPPTDRQPPLGGMNGAASGYRGSVPARKPVPLPPPNVRLDRIVALPPSPGIQGQVVRGDRRPQPNARVLFVNASRHDNRQAVTAGSDGQFRVSLASGAWWVYVNDGAGQMIRHSKVELKDSETRQVTLVSSAR